MDPDRVVRQVGSWPKRVLSVLVPPLCLTCGVRLTADRRWLCERCSVTMAVDARPMHRLIEVGKGKTIDVWYCFGYTSSISALVEELKYGDKPGLAEILVPYMASALVVRPGRRTRVVPVPVHPSKRRERGYNQSGLLAEGLARSLGLRFGDVLAKTRATVSQTGLDREVRLRNVTGSIGVKKAAAIPFGRALLVDDVVTTGSTLRECACALEAAGVREIGACAVASSA